MTEKDFKKIINDQESKQSIKTKLNELKDDLIYPNQQLIIQKRRVLDEAQKIM